MVNSYQWGWVVVVVANVILESAQVLLLWTSD